MSDRTSTDYETSPQQDDLALHAEEIEAAMTKADFFRVAELIESDPAATWFGLTPARTSEIVKLLLQRLTGDSWLLRIARIFYSRNASEQLDSTKFLSTLNFNDPREVYILSFFLALRRWSFEGTYQRRA